MVDIRDKWMKFFRVKTNITSTINLWFHDTKVWWGGGANTPANKSWLGLLHYCSYYLIINLYINSLFLTSESPPNAPIMIAKDTKRS